MVFILRKRFQGTDKAEDEWEAATLLIETVFNYFPLINLVLNRQLTAFKLVKTFYIHIRRCLSPVNYTFNAF